MVKADQAVVGTSAVRRIAQLRGKYPNLKFVDIRGILNTRLKKLDDPEGAYEAIILAKAGMMRLNWQQRIQRVTTDFFKFLLEAYEVYLYFWQETLPMLTFEQTLLSGAESGRVSPCGWSRSLGS